MALNADQQRAVECDDNLLVLAPPGSGKTGTLVEKTKFIVSHSPGAFVLLCTFTDAAANEAYERLQHALTKEQLRQVRVATFHKHTIEQLRQSNKLGKILSPYDSTNMLRKSLAAVGSSLDLMAAESLMQAAKSTPDYTGEEEEFIAEYERRKRDHRCIDLQDVIREAVVGMRNKTVKPMPATHVLCDEFQDVDWNQLHWLFCYFDLGATITVVGDDDQSVYSFRNSLGYDAMAAFIERVRPTVIDLSVNYRSNSEILQAAMDLIRHNEKRMPKKIISHKGPGGSVVKRVVVKKNDEAMYVAKEIISDVLANDYELDSIPDGRWGIIARTNADLWLISKVLWAQNIPHVRTTKKDDAPRDIKLFCSFLISIQTNDTLGLDDVLTTLGLTQKSSTLLHAKMGDNFFEIMDGVFPELDEMTIEEKAGTKSFLQLCPNWRAATAKGQYTRVIEAVGLFFLEKIVRGDDNKTDFKGFYEILAGTVTMEKNSEIPGQQHARAFLHRPPKGNLQQRVQQFNEQDDKVKTAGVSLFTMHGSKGLEFDRVIVVQCNNGTIPSSHSTSVDEERRLFFVAMTRARNWLRLTCSPSKGVSPFLHEFNPGSFETRDPQPAGTFQ